VEILYQTEEVNNITDPKPLDLYGHSTGVEMSPLDWHESISLLQNHCL
jgi:hypothetical protein